MLKSRGVLGGWGGGGRGGQPVASGWGRKVQGEVMSTKFGGDGMSKEGFHNKDKGSVLA